MHLSTLRPQGNFERHVKQLLGLLLLAVVCFGLLVGPGGRVRVQARISAPAATFTAQNNCQPKIAFVSRRDGRNEIYAMNADGSEQSRLTVSQTGSVAPSVSTDGSRIAYVTSSVGANADVWVMNSDGSRRQLTRDPAGDFQPAFSRDGTKIAFTSDRDGNTEIYVMNSDGSDQTRLTDNAATDSAPCFSPDGAKIAFTSNRNGNTDIYVINADGSGETRLTNDSDVDESPSFSPDGSKIAFDSSRGNQGQIYVMNADGSNQTSLSADGSDPSFSPDGTKIAFGSRRDGDPEIYVMNGDGSGQTRLTNSPGNDVTPSFGGPLDSDGDGVPDGCDNCPHTPNPPKIAFTSSRDAANGEIYLMNADGSGLTRLTTNSSVDTLPSISRDGTRIAFVSPRDGQYQIYVMNADGSNQTKLTTEDLGVEPLKPSISPDGTRIAFTSTRDGNSEIYVMNADGSGQTRLTSNATVDSLPSFSGDGTRIAFTSLRDGNPEIYVMNGDGSGQTRLTNNTDSDTQASFSGDGTRIAFTSSRDGNLEIYIMNADGSGQTRLTNNTDQDSRPSFSADGARIAFDSLREDNWEIYVMNADGTNQHNLTNNVAVDLAVSFGGQLDSDGDGIGDACNNQPPTANAGLDQTIECAGLTSQVTLNGAGSSDPDGDTLTYSWKEGATQIATGVAPTVNLANGVHILTLMVTDPSNASNSDTVTISVGDHTAPVITLTSNVIKLNTPNHKYVNFTVRDFVSSVSDGCDSSVDINKIVITNVTSDEPENANGNGDGNTTGDIVIAANCKSVQFRAERAEESNGRVYTITLKVKDSAGNVGMAVRKVFVPLNSGGTAIDGPGPGYTVAGCNP